MVLEINGFESYEDEEGCDRGDVYGSARCRTRQRIISVVAANRDTYKDHPHVVDALDAGKTSFVVGHEVVATAETACSEWMALASWGGA